MRKPLWRTAKTCAGLCVLACALLNGCGGTDPRPDNGQALLMQRMLDDKEEQQMRSARVEQRLANLEQTVNELKSAPAATRAQVFPAGQESAPQASSPTLVTVPTSPASPTAATAPAAAPKPSRAPARAPATPPEYQKALALLLEAEKPAESRTAFSVFLTDNPNHALTPNVLYWVGETYYAEKQYEDAILLFKDVAARFPQHDKAPDALFKAAMAYRSLGDTENAAYLEKLLLEDYPKSRSAGLLRQRSG